MKIAMIEKEEPLKMAGVGVFNARLSEYLRSHGHRVETLRFTKDTAIEKNVRSIPYYFAEKKTTVWLPTEKSYGVIKNGLADIQPDLIYCSPGVSPLDFLLPSIADGMHIPLAGTWHADLNKRFSSTGMAAKAVFMTYVPYCKKLSLLHVFSDRLKDFYVENGVDPGNILVLPNGVDPEIYSPGKSKFAQKNDITCGVLFLGRLTYIKNPELAVKCFLAADPPKGTKMVVVGTGELEGKLREGFPDDRVIFTGVIEDQQEKIDIIRSCQVFVLPSKFEGLPLTVLEAMACGLGCITTDVASLETVLSGCGIVLEEDKVKEQLPLAMKLMISFPEFARELGKKARVRILEKYDQEKIFGKLTSEMERVVRESKGNSKL